MTCFKLTLRLATPFFISYPMTLDGLLSAAVFRETGLKGEDTTPHIPLEQGEMGIFRGSALFLPSRHGRAPVSRVMSLKCESDLSTQAFKPNKRGGVYGPVDQERGPFKANLDSYSGFEAHEAYFWGAGDVDRVVQLISDHIPGIGKRTNGGAGEIVAVLAEEIEDDFSWVTVHNKPARPLPADLWKTIQGTDEPTVPMRVRLPYWEGEFVDAVFPVGLVC